MAGRRYHQAIAPGGIGLCRAMALVEQHKMSDTIDYTVLTYGPDVRFVASYLANCVPAEGDIPVATLYAFASKGLTHYLGNELAAKRTAFKKGFVEKEGREPEDSEVVAWEGPARAAMIELARTGEVGAGNRGPRGPQDPVGDLAESLARGEVVAAVEQRGLTKKLTKKNVDKMVEDYYNAKRDHFRAMAQKSLDRAAKVQDAALEALFNVAA
jgi:hypothetical protein